MENDNDQGPKPAKISKFTNGNELSTITENTEPNSTTPSNKYLFFIPILYRKQLVAKKYKFIFTF